MTVHTVKDSSSPLNLALTKDNIYIHCMLFSYPLFIVNSSYIGKSMFDLCSQYFPAGYCAALCMRRNSVFKVGISQVCIFDSKESDTCVEPSRVWKAACCTIRR